MATPDIKGFFSQEHRLIIYLITALFLWQSHGHYTMQKVLLSNADIKADIKIITFRLNDGKKAKPKQLAKADIHGCSGKSEFQTSSSLLAVIRRNPLYCFESTD